MRKISKVGTKQPRRTKPQKTAAKRKASQPRVAKALALMRKGLSLRKAAQTARVSPRTVIKRASSALRKNQRGRYTTAKTDRLVRTLMIPTPHGPEEISLLGLRAASLLGQYWSAVHRYYETGDTTGLEKFRGQSVRAIGGTEYPLLTDTEILDRLGSAGVLSFESLYAKA